MLSIAAPRIAVLWLNGQSCGPQQSRIEQTSLWSGFVRSSEKTCARRLGPAWTGGEWPLSPSPVSAARSRRRPRDRRERSKHVEPPGPHCRLGYPRRLQGRAPGEKRGEICTTREEAQELSQQTEHWQPFYTRTMGNIAARQASRSIYHDPSIRRALQQRGFAPLDNVW